jgi:hypothetical protein
MKRGEPTMNAHRIPFDDLVIDHAMALLVNRLGGHQ